MRVPFLEQACRENDEGKQVSTRRGGFEVRVIAAAKPSDTIEERVRAAQLRPLPSLSAIRLVYREQTIDMGISLAKGQRLSLDKVAPSLQAVFVGLGWDVKTTSGGPDFDLDASVFLLGDNEKLPSDQHFVFYNNLKSPDPDGSVEHMGDNRTGAGEGDDEVILVNLVKIPPEVQKLAFVISIDRGDERGHNFGQVSNAFVRVVDVKTKEEVLRYDLTEDYSVETAMVLAEFYRREGGWRVNAVGTGYQGGLPALLERYQ